MNLLLPRLARFALFRKAHVPHCAALLLALLCPVVARAHIGSPNVFFEGPAGPYPVRVTIEPPGVVPGLAQIHVRVHSGQPQTVTVLPVRWDAGTRGAPPPDVARPVPGETNLFTAQLWLMDSGAYSVFVDVSGPQGRGTAIVPLNSLAFQRLGLSRGMSLLFLGLGAFLVVLLVSVVGSAVREASVPPGAETTPARRRLALAVMAVSVLVVTGVLWFGNGWWGAVDREFFSRRLYRTPAIKPEVKTGDRGGRELLLHAGPVTRRAESSPLVPDHGHIMHLFLIREPAGDVFAHLHPARYGKGNDFKTALPALPASDYELFADITHESGLTQTLTNILHLAGADESTNAAQSFADSDDAVDLTAPAAPGPVTLPGEFHLAPAFKEPFTANQDITLRFDITTDAGAPAPLEPYLGMYGHLIVQNADGSVFAHLHPLGSISMTSQRLFAEREHAGYLANQPLELLCAPPSPTLAFPYAFPKPGRYRLWLQTKIRGQIQTAGYVITVD